MFGIALAQEAASKPAPTGGGMNSLVGFLPIILIFVVLYFIMILPQQRRQKKHRQMIDAIKRGDRVVLASGIHGIITNVKEHTFLVKLAESTEIEVDKSSISYKFGAQQ
ncbi:preprotein translocase subunit YajC [candidate division WOR-3 bacterium JGI_Cruoil_03_51_56]|uniref:Preprotein translocase subunit YajC n=1 Tax=candidate division WOR-3 bacterium JGI_Cruoil_03_51_56 TaxID=1973747 RepID=A0A235BP23_UNCW3|nr:MAG: preprotein translocase subunit YajC [candidate division WOR-3 bacterium JGI_Cruoil_03_51_56]